MKKAVYGLMVLSLSFSFTACGGSDTPTDQSNQEQTQEQVLEFTLPDEERNTSEMVNALIYLARDNAEIASDADLEAAINFINDNYPDYFSDNDSMEKTIYYGSLIEYKNKGIDEDMQALGFYAATSVKYVYRNIDTIDADDTKYHLGRLKNKLDKINGIESPKLTDEERQAVLDFDTTLWDIVLESESAFNEFSSTMNDYSAGNATLLEVKIAAIIAVDAQSELSKSIPSGDERSQRYVDAVSNYVSNSQNIASTFISFIDTENQDYLTESKNYLNSVPSYAFSIVSERIRYLSSCGLSDDEIDEICELSASDTETN